MGMPTRTQAHELRGAFARFLLTPPLGGGGAVREGALCLTTPSGRTARGAYARTDSRRMTDIPRDREAACSAHVTIGPPAGGGSCPNPPSRWRHRGYFNGDAAPRNEYRTGEQNEATERIRFIPFNLPRSKIRPLGEKCKHVEGTVRTSHI